MKKLLLLFALAVVAMPCGAHCPCPSNEIWYTNGSTTEPTKPRDTFDVNIISNTYYAENECWVIKFDGEVTTIRFEAFGGCSSLTSVYCKAITPPAGGDFMFYDNASGCKIYVPMESVNAYKSAEGWSDYADAIVGYNF